MNKKSVLWITAIVAVVLLTGFAFTNSDLVCQTGEKLGIVKTSSSCDYEGKTSSTTVLSSTQKSIHCPEGTASDCPYSKEKAVQAQKQDCSECPYSNSKAAIAQKENKNTEGEALTSVE